MGDNGRKVKNVPQELHIDVERHLQCISYRLVSDPNGPISRIYSFLRHILRGQGGGMVAKTASSGASLSILVPLWSTLGVTFGHFGVTFV